MALMYCRECGQKISSEAPTCPRCGVPHPVLLPDGTPAAAAAAWAVPYTAPRDNGLAGVLSFFVPGAGQIYRGRVGQGFAWMLAVPIGYVCFILPGLVLHALCIANAARDEPRMYRWR
ncbi:MAG TPA: hypothetical protein VFQ45_22315 [Longimicrobium sp.]|nr:hypothetical protein [Longimicrobium sp.]